MDRGPHCLLDLAPRGTRAVPGVDTYLSCFTGMVICFVIAFELPLAIVLVSVVGVGIRTHERSASGAAWATTSWPPPTIRTTRIPASRSANTPGKQPVRPTASHARQTGWRSSTPSPGVP